ncbi:MAG TPA: hypothetical protein VFY91_01310 [Microbacterium sp.]|nr:hypothetical protein [Microbacterium sp.]
MDAVPPPDDELAALRRRAYGPDADIGADPHAQARLAELERAQAPPISRAHAGSPGADGYGPADDEVAAPHSGAQPAAAGGTGQPGPAAGAPALPAADRGPPGARRAHPRLPWVIAAIAAIVALVSLGVHVVDAVTRPRAEARLVALDQPLSGDVPPTLDQDELQFLETTAPDWVSYGGYGALRVWSTSAPNDWRCLAVVFEQDLWRFNCTAPTIDTTADVVIVSRLLPADAPGGPIPEDSTVRFVLHDDVVDVYIERNPTPVPSPGG